MSSKRLAAMVAAGQTEREHQPLRAADRTPHLNLLLASAVLGGVLVAACLSCYCCGRRKERNRGRGAGTAKFPQGAVPSPQRDPSIYTLHSDCPQQYQSYDPPSLPPYRRPPTPGPPPAYESVVSKDDMYRRFGEDGEYQEEHDKLTKYSSNDLLNCQHQDSMNSLDKLRQCTFQGNCTCYSEQETFCERYPMPADEERDAEPNARPVETDQIYEINNDTFIKIQDDYHIVDRTKCRHQSCKESERNTNETCRKTKEIEMKDQTDSDLILNIETNENNLQQTTYTSCFAESKGNRQVFHNGTCGHCDDAQGTSKSYTIDVEDSAATSTGTYQTEDRQDGDEMDSTKEEFDTSLPTYDAAVCLEAQQEIRRH